MLHKLAGGPGPQAIFLCHCKENNDATSWLQNQSIETIDYLSRGIHALSVAEVDEDTVFSYKETFDLQEEI
ncbi:MAG: hypothetical protein GXP46_10585 [Deferribacteres bacterium]|nr:hypothetical protein [Deferribacteres bacterium]